MSAAGEMWMRWRVRVGYPIAVVYGWLADPTPIPIVIGAAVAVVGLLIRGAAAGHLRKHEALATGGPYAYTRNPLYFGSVVLGAGFLVAGRSLAAAAVVAAYLLLFYPAVMRREEQELRARYGAAFEDYAARVPFFWPRLRAARASAARFSWELYHRNKENRALLGVVAGLLLLVAKWIWWG